jgi:homoserine kinase
VAGLVSARHIGELEMSDADLARLAVKIEGHADNVLPALFGGLVLSAQDGWLRFEPIEQITPLVLIARDKFKTQEARRVLPAEVSRADAVANSAATAALIAVLTGQQPVDALLVATEDRIHEPHRLPLMPETLDMHAALRGKGIPTALAGAGPSLVCLIGSDRRAEALSLAQDLIPEGWQVLLAEWDLQGAQVR